MTLDVDMAAETAKEAIFHALEDLEKTELEKFCSSLLARREEGEPRIRQYAIEDKSRTEIADKLVTTFTEDKAVEVTLNILIKIHRNDVAQELQNWMEQSKGAVASVSDRYIPTVDLLITPESLKEISPQDTVECYDPKAQLMSKLKFLQHYSYKCQKFEQTYKDVFQHNKKKVVTTEKQIRAEIQKLHQLLREEEEKRVSALKKEEKQKAEIVTRAMKNIQEQFSSLSDQMSEIEQELKKPCPSFSGKCILLKPQLVSGVLIDVAKHLGNLTYRVCKDIKKKVKFSPVILDPNTANGYLSLSEDLTSVGDAEPMQQLPDNPERFTMYPTVLGSEGFRSGTHTWEVEVGDLPRWNIGYVKKSVNRKAGQKSIITPRGGIWCLRRHRSMEYSNGVKYFSLQRNPQRIRVQLDYDKGELSFYDTEDMTHIYTHEDTFTEELYPYLNYEKASDAKTTHIRICQVAQGPIYGSVSGSCRRRMTLPKPSGGLPNGPSGPRGPRARGAPKPKPPRAPAPLPPPQHPIILITTTQLNSKTPNFHNRSLSWRPPIAPKLGGPAEERIKCEDGAVDQLTSEDRNAL